MLDHEQVLLAGAQEQGRLGGGGPLREPLDGVSDPLPTVDEDMVDPGGVAESVDGGPSPLQFRGGEAGERGGEPGRGGGHRGGQGVPRHGVGSHIMDNRLLTIPGETVSCNRLEKTISGGHSRRWSPMTVRTPRMMRSKTSADTRLTSHRPTATPTGRRTRVGDSRHDRSG